MCSCVFARSAPLIPAEMVSFCEEKEGFTPIYEQEDGCSYGEYRAMASVNAGMLSGFSFSVGYASFRVLQLSSYFTSPAAGDFGLYVGGLAINE
jgi:hypothetical protein